MSDASWYHHKIKIKNNKITLQNILVHRSWLVEGPFYPYPDRWIPVNLQATTENSSLSTLLELNLSLYLSLLPLLACTYLKNAWDLVLRTLVFGFIDLLSVWTIEIKAIIFFPLHHIALNRIVMNRIALHSNRGESYRIVSHRIASCFICIFNVSYRWLCIEIHITLASVMTMRIPTESVEHSHLRAPDTDSISTVLRPRNHKSVYRCCVMLPHTVENSLTLWFIPSGHFQSGGTHSGPVHFPTKYLLY